MDVCRCERSALIGEKLCRVAAVAVNTPTHRPHIATPSYTQMRVKSLIADARTAAPTTTGLSMSPQPPLSSSRAGTATSIFLVFPKRPAALTWIFNSSTMTLFCCDFGSKSGAFTMTIPG